MGEKMEKGHARENPVHLRIAQPDQDDA